MLTLYGINLSTFTRKLRLALAEKGIDYRFEQAPMGSARVRALHPLAKIPVAEHDGLVIPDSSVIIAYLERLWPQPALYPQPAAGFAQALWLEEYADTRLREATLPYFAERIVKPLFQGRQADESVLERAGPLRDEAFAYLESVIAGRCYAVDDRFSVADIAIGAQLVTYQQGAGLPDAARWPGLARYLEGLLVRPAWVTLLAEEADALAAARARRR
ncbi:MAG: glutathione S-transferase family protein [Gammaproteobacteria bacterium]|nr:glutathione S-transferase family protein [Gammaproteobacteria bacterium]